MIAGIVIKSGAKKLQNCDILYGEADLGRCLSYRDTHQAFSHDDSRPGIHFFLGGAPRLISLRDCMVWNYLDWQTRLEPPTDRMKVSTGISARETRSPQFKPQRISGLKFKGILSKAYRNWCHVVLPGANLQPVRCNNDVDPMLAIHDIELYSLQLVREVGVKLQPILTGFDAGVAPLDKVNGTGHGTQMNPFGGSATLDVGNIGFKGFLKEMP